MSTSPNTSLSDTKAGQVAKYVMAPTFFGLPHVLRSLGMPYFVLTRHALGEKLWAYRWPGRVLWYGACLQGPSWAVMIARPWSPVAAVLVGIVSTLTALACAGAYALADRQLSIETRELQASGAAPHPDSWGRPRWPGLSRGRIMLYGLLLLAVVPVMDLSGRAQVRQEDPWRNSFQRALAPDAQPATHGVIGMIPILSAPCGILLLIGAGFYGSIQKYDTERGSADQPAPAPAKPRSRWRPLWVALGTLILGPIALLIVAVILFTIL